MKEVKIIIKDNYGDVVLETTNITYEKDIKENKDKLDIWWRCYIEYDDGKVGYDYPYNHNGLSPRKVIYYNDRLVYASYNFPIAGKKNVAKNLLEYFNEDFKTNVVPDPLKKANKSLKDYIHKTSKNKT